MGITGLLPLLRSVTEPIHISAYADQTVAVDTYGWLHRGLHAAPSSASPNTAFIPFILGRIQMLLNAKVRPILVFDGGPLPAKRAQEAQREERRTRNRQTALAMTAAGNDAAAERLLRQAIDVDPTMAKQAIDAIRHRFHDRVDVVVAPFEADAQLAWLVNNGHAAAAVSEDSDLLCFGCDRVVFKLDGAGRAEQIRLERIGAARSIDLGRWSLDDFQLMCVLSGCDYLASIAGLGLKTAHRLVADERHLDRIMRRLRLQGRFIVPDGYAASVVEALLTFRHQRVFDVVSRRLVHLNPVPVNVSLPDGGAFLGQEIAPETAAAIADAVIDPTTMRPFDDAPALLAPTESHARRSFQSSLVRPERVTLVRQYGDVPKAVSLSAMDTFRHGTKAPTRIRPRPCVSDDFDVIVAKRSATSRKAAPSCTVESPSELVSRKRISLPIEARSRARRDHYSRDMGQQLIVQRGTSSSPTLVSSSPIEINPRSTSINWPMPMYVRDEGAEIRREPELEKDEDNGEGDTLASSQQVESGRPLSDVTIATTASSKMSDPESMSIAALLSAKQPLSAALQAFDFYRYAGIKTSKVDAILDAYDG